MLWPALFHRRAIKRCSGMRKMRRVINRKTARAMLAEWIGEIDCRGWLLPTVMQSTQQPLWNSTHISGVSNFIVFIDYIVEVRTATRCGVVKLGWVPIFNSIWEHWRSQLWGTGACAPRRPAIYFFQFPLEVVWQRLFILYSASAAAVLQSQLYINLVHHFVSLYVSKII